MNTSAQTNAKILSNMSVDEVTTLFERAHDAAINSARENINMDVMWPCGFAWVSLKIRKNHKYASILTSCGFKWNDYAKEYQNRGYLINHSQNMDYRIAFMSAMGTVLSNAGLDTFVESRMD